MTYENDKRVWIIPALLPVGALVYVVNLIHGIFYPVLHPLLSICTYGTQ